MQRRWRSKPLWAATIALILFVLKTYFNIEIAKVDVLVDMILVIATLLGVFNNPSDKINF